MKSGSLALISVLALFAAPAAWAECSSFSMTMHYAHSDVSRTETCKPDGSTSYSLQIDAAGESVELSSDPEVPYPGVDMAELDQRFACSREISPEGEAILAEVTKRMHKGHAEKAQRLLLQKRLTVLDCPTHY